LPEEHECIVCHRIPAKEIFRICHMCCKNLPKDIIHNIAVQCCQAINVADKKNRIFLCGKSRFSLIGSLIWLFSMKEKGRFNSYRITQSTIANCLKMTEPPLRQLAKSWLVTFPELFPFLEIEEKEIVMEKYSFLYGKYLRQKCWRKEIIAKL